MDKSSETKVTVEVMKKRAECEWQARQAERFSRAEEARARRKAKRAARLATREVSHG